MNEANPALVTPGDIDVAILTKELEVTYSKDTGNNNTSIAFAEQLVKCMAVVQKEFQSERTAIIQVQARSYEHILATVDAYDCYSGVELTCPRKLAAFRRDMEQHLTVKLGAFQVQFGAKFKCTKNVAIAQAHQDKMQEETRSASVVSDTPSSLHGADLEQLMCLSDGEGSQPVDALSDYGDAPPLTPTSAPQTPAAASLLDCGSNESLLGNEISTHIQLLAHGLQRIGFGSGQSLLVLSKTPLRTFCLVMAAWSAGGQVEYWCVGNLALPDIEHSLPTFACVDEARDVSGIHALMPSVKVISLVDSITKADFQYSKLQVSSPKTHCTLSPSHEVALVLISHDAITELWTRTVHRHTELIQELDGAVHRATAKPTLMSLSLMSPLGLLLGVLPTMMSGNALYLLDVNNLSGPILAKLLFIHEQALKLRHWRKWVQQSLVSVMFLYNLTSKVNPRLRFRREFCNLTAVVASSEPELLPIPAPLVHSVGRPPSYATSTIVIQSLATNEVLGPKQVGELCLRHHMPDQAIERLGILAYVDAAQLLHLIGSKDGILKLGFEATTALELEEVIASHPLVDDAVVTYPPSSRASLVAYIKLTATALCFSSDALHSIHAYACKQIPKTKQFHRLVAVHAIPRDSIGHAYRGLVVTNSNAIETLNVM
ncbi:hypothetical protein ACHHYP_00579 [Achlya hypogyna]|uniref:AMP-dependent synthetase/ligase domain-containing protein n=1 Tax=Achlya hypogyna TaxID=1202772 RepID=A0A1V9ZUA0_ACHHY|nr:hypothetical protein ACHHYP_00579 [Achlya hypogyna]